MTGEEQLIGKLDVEGRKAYKKTGVPMGAVDIPPLIQDLEGGKNVTISEKLRRKDKGNPGRPPKKWWDRTFRDVKAGGYDDETTAKIVGDIWHNKLSDAKRAEIMKESEGNPGNPDIKSQLDYSNEIFERIVECEIHTLKALKEKIIQAVSEIRFIDGQAPMPEKIEIAKKVLLELEWTVKSINEILDNCKEWKKDVIQGKDLEEIDKYLTRMYGF